MSHYNNSIGGTMPGKQNDNEIASFEKSVMSNAKQSIQKHLSHMKIDQNQLNYSLFLSIQNFKLEERTDECVLILLRHKANPNCEFSTSMFILRQRNPTHCRLSQRTTVTGQAKPDLCNKNGQHPLSVILQDKRQNYDVAQTLLNSMTSINIQLNGKYPIVIAIERQFHRIFQLFIQKGANLVFQHQNVLHVIVKKKFKKNQKKKKFIKQLAGRLFLMQQDSARKLPIDYEQNEQMRSYILENFKPKVQKQQSSKSDLNKSVNQKEKQVKQSKQSKNRDSDGNNKQKQREKQKQRSRQKDMQSNIVINIKKKSSVLKQKQLDVSSEIEEEELLEEKDRTDPIVQNNKIKKQKLKQLGVISQQQQNRQLKQNKQNNIDNLSKFQKQGNNVGINVSNMGNTNSPLIINKKGTQNSNIRESQNFNSKNHTIQKSLQKSQLQTTVQKQKEQQKGKKKQNNINVINQTKKKVNQSQIWQQSSGTTNPNTKKKKPRNNEQIIPKTLLKRKNSLLQQENIKNDKNKSSIIKKGWNKKQKQVNQLNLPNFSNQKPDKFKNSANLGQNQQIQKNKNSQGQNSNNRIEKQPQDTQLQLQIEQKVQKQSQTDSEQSQVMSIVNLNDQIYEFVNQMTIQNQKRVHFIQGIIKFLQSKIKDFLNQEKQNIRFQMYLYGSQSTGLAIQNSDVDLLVVSDFNYGTMMKLLQQKRVLQCQQIIQAKFITGATVPVIKIQFGQTFDHINADITFQTRNHTGLKCSQMIKAFMQAEPLLRPLVLVIKVLVKVYSINDPYKGGISSYAITLMVIALLQFTQIHKKQPQNVGQLLLNFFYFYGEQIDYVSQAIIIHALGLFGQQPLYCIYRLPYFTDLNPKLIIYDPLNPVNNVGRTTYRISALKKLFSVCYLRFKQSPYCHLKDILDGSFGELLLDF